MSFDSVFETLRTMVSGASGTAPVLRCISARTSWTVPSGYAYDADVDRYVDSGGVVWTPTTSGLPYTDVATLPSAGALTLDFMAGGVVDTGERTVRVKTADIATVTAAEYYTLDSQEYVLAEKTPFPAGAPMMYTVRLKRR